MTKRVLVTGAGGFVGSHLVERLLRVPDWHVVAVDSFRHNGEANRLLDAIDVANESSARARERVTVLTHDLTAPFSAQQVSAMETVDVVLDFASRSSVDQSITDPRGFIEHNVATTLTTLDLARLVGPSLYLHMSTDEVYGCCIAPCGENDHRPSSPYSASKAAQDDVCHAYTRTYDVPLVTVTSSNMFGERQSQLAFVPRLVRATLRDELITVHTRDGIPGTRLYNYVGDVVDWLVELLVELEPVEWEKRVAFTGRYELNNLELAEHVIRLVCELHDNVPRPRVERREVDNLRPGYDQHYHELTNCEDDPWLHLSNLLNAPFDDRIAQTVRWFVEHPTWLG